MIKKSDLIGNCRTCGKEITAERAERARARGIEPLYDTAECQREAQRVRSALRLTGRSTVVIGDIVHRLAHFGIVPATLCGAHRWNSTAEFMLQRVSLQLKPNCETCNTIATRKAP